MYPCANGIAITVGRRAFESSFVIRGLVLGMDPEAACMPDSSFATEPQTSPFLRDWVNSHQSELLLWGLDKFVGGLGQGTLVFFLSSSSFPFYHSMLPESYERPASTLLPRNLQSHEPNKPLSLLITRTNVLLQQQKAG